MSHTSAGGVAVTDQRAIYDPPGARWPERASATRPAPNASVAPATIARHPPSEWIIRGAEEPVARYTRVAEVDGVLWVFQGDGSVFGYDAELDDQIRAERIPGGPLTDFAIAALDGQILLIGGRRGEHAKRTIRQFDPSRRRWARACLELPAGRHRHCAIGLRGALYVVGGYVGDHVSTATLSAETLTGKGAASGFTPIASLQAPRADMGVAGRDGSIWVAGGADARDRSLSSVEVMRSGGWAPARALQQPRRSPALVMAGQALYAIGGLDQAEEAMTSVEIMPSLDGSALWQAGPPLPLGGRFSLGAGLVDDQLIVVGGCRRAEHGAQSQPTSLPAVDQLAEAGQRGGMTTPIVALLVKTG